MLLRHLLVLTALAVCSACGGDDHSLSDAGFQADGSLLPGPSADSDPFYAAPEVVPDQPGMILKSRPISYQPAGVPQPNEAWQLQYVTQDRYGRPVAAVTTVVKPVAPNAYGQPVLLSFQHAYNSLGAACTPSRTATGSAENQTNAAETLEYLPPLQALGWTLVIPDFEGPQHALGAGPLAGRATLDSIRAALAFESLGLPADTPVGLWGYSGGSYATTWTAALHPDYAPEINLSGVVAGGTAIDLFDIVRRTEGTEQFPGFFTLLQGMAREYPELLPAHLLTDMGLNAMNAFRDSCAGAPAEGSTPEGESMSDYLASDDPYQLPGFKAVRPKVTLLNSGLHPTADIFMYHEIGDAVVPVETADQLAGQWCEAGVPLGYYRSNAAPVLPGVPPAVGHTAGAAFGTPAAIAYLDSRFAGAGEAMTPPGTVRCN